MIRELDPDGWGYLLLLLSHFSRVLLCVTPSTAAHQAPLSLGLSRQEHWSGLPFPSPMHESEVAQSCPTLSNPMDCNLPGSFIHGIFQARVLEWGAITFSRGYLQNTSMLEWYLETCYPSLSEEEEDSQKQSLRRRGGKNTEQLYKKYLHDPGNHNRVFTHLEPDILECKVKWALWSVTMSKAS